MHKSWNPSSKKQGLLCKSPLKTYTFCSNCPEAPPTPAARLEPERWGWGALGTAPWAQIGSQHKGHCTEAPAPTRAGTTTTTGKHPEKLPFNSMPGTAQTLPHTSADLSWHFQFPPYWFPVTWMWSELVCEILSCLSRQGEAHHCAPRNGGKPFYLTWAKTPQPSDQINSAEAA